MIHIQHLEDISIDQLCIAHNKAFEDYEEPNYKTVDELQYMLQRRGYVPRLSFGALDGDELVSFTFNGIGEWNGLTTAYDTGTGTIKAYRQQGLASRIFNESVTVLKQQGIMQYLLEVIRINTKAKDLYTKAGFRIVRELDYYISIKDKIAIHSAHCPYIISEVEQPDWGLLQSFWDFQPSWQNAVDAIARKRAHFKIFAAFAEDKIVGYGIVEPHTGDIPQLAVSKEHRRKKAATTLLYHLINSIDVDLLKIINSDAVYDPFKSFMTSLQLPPGYGQYEMIKQL